jgi:hypothetical protein
MAPSFCELLYCEQDSRVHDMIWQVSDEKKKKKILKMKVGYQFHPIISMLAVLFRLIFC